MRTGSKQKFQEGSHSDFDENTISIFLYRPAFGQVSGQFSFEFSVFYKDV